MIQYKLEDAPIVYYLSGRERKQWVLFLHAAFVDHNLFQAEVSHFQNQYNVLTLDIIGHGRSTDTRKGDSIDKMSGWIHEILEREKIEKLHLVGVSLGAVLAQDFANRFPEAVLSLACFGGYDINNFDPSLQQGNNSAQLGMMLKAMLSVKWFAKANRSISAYTEQGRQAFYEMNLKFPKKSFRYLASLNRMINAHPSAPRPYPLLIGCGQHDIPMEKTAIAQWKQHEPDCQVAILEGAGHCVNLDSPQQFHQVLEEFWAKHS